jgi:hypothetical protein
MQQQGMFGLLLYIRIVQMTGAVALGGFKTKRLGLRLKVSFRNDMLSAVQLQKARKAAQAAVEADSKYPGPIKRSRYAFVLSLLL